MTQTAFDEMVTPAEYGRYAMADVDAVEKDLTAVGSFSGCGGSSLGLRLAGFRVPYAIEFVEEAAATYMANAPEAYVDTRDIRDVDAEEILERIGLDRGELDLFEGSPPCASFSNAGRGDALWGEVKNYSTGKKQRTDDLFFEWARILGGLMPKAFIAENVGALSERTKAREEYCWKIADSFSALGYHVRAGVINAANYGVPSARRRLFFVGVRKDLGVDVRFPPPKTTETAHTLRQALSDISWRTRPGQFGRDAEVADREACSIERFAIGRLWKALVVDGVDRDSIDRLRREEEHRAKVEGRDAEVELKDYFSLAIPKLDEPCPTLTATAGSIGAASVVHPEEPRKFTPAECLAISGFPVDFELTGDVSQRIERVGRAVPPLMMAAVAREVAEAIR